jgi:glycosyltransferase involved in cell wall biosynthesis
MSLNISEAHAVHWSPSAVRRAALPRVLYALVLDPDKKFGSMEEQIVVLAQRFHQEHSLFLPLFISNPASDVSQFRGQGVEAVCLDLQRFSWRTLLTLRRLLRERRIDIVHWNFMPPLTNQYVWALSLLTPGVRHWFTDHNSRLFPLPAPPTGVTRFVKRLLLKRYGRVLCVSRYVQDCLAEQDVWSNIVCVRHFINTDRFRPDETVRRQQRATLNAGAHFVLLVVGHLIKEKGIDVAVRALSELPPHVVLWIVGGGPEEEALRRLIADLRLDDRVQLLGLQRDVQPYLRAADCFICPSLWGEAAGLVNLEAQGCGTPILASRIGGIPEYVHDGRSGFLFAPGDSHELAGCVRRLVEEPDLRAHFAQEARVVALEQFAPEVRLTEWLDLYRRFKGVL